VETFRGKIFTIKSNNDACFEIADTESLSSKIFSVCEVYELIYGKKDLKFVGHISKNGLLYIIVSFLENAINKYTICSDDLSDHKESLRLCKSWIEDEETFCLLELARIKQTLSLKTYRSKPILDMNSFSSDKANACIGGAILEFLYYMFPTSKSQASIIEILEGIDMAKTACGIYDFNERERQGEFIIDFLTSGKSLFFK